MEYSKQFKIKAVQSKTYGFTLIELMVTIAIVGIITAIAVPRLSDFTLKLRVDNEITQIQRLLMTARNAAINSGQNTSLCPLKNDDTCDAGSTDWTGRVGVVGANGLIKEKDEVSAGDKLQFAFSNVTYNASGRLANNNFGAFSYCPSGNIKLSRAVEVHLSGRSYLSDDYNGDGRDQSRNNANINCN